MDGREDGVIRGKVFVEVVEGKDYGLQRYFMSPRTVSTSLMGGSMNQLPPSSRHRGRMQS